MTYRIRPATRDDVDTIVALARELFDEVAVALRDGGIMQALEHRDPRTGGAEPGATQELFELVDAGRRVFFRPGHEGELTATRGGRRSRPYISGPASAPPAS
jgi:hypothetical protein